MRYELTDYEWVAIKPRPRKPHAAQARAPKFVTFRAVLPTRGI
jgi:hypothetical protein